MSSTSRDAERNIAGGNSHMGPNGDDSRWWPVVAGGGALGILDVLSPSGGAHAANTGGHRSSLQAMGSRSQRRCNIGKSQANDQTYRASVSGGGPPIVAVARRWEGIFGTRTDSPALPDTTSVVCVRCEESPTRTFLAATTLDFKEEGSLKTTSLERALPLAQRASSSPTKTPYPAPSVPS
ncbi:hypothetical protein GQ53DRAFT_807405 [Thozetella sp. PMI_491]|nr:hypothetical protein GQ53DRAFT_807405 [Thozetella sp. PMI_491]